MDRYDDGNPEAPPTDEQKEAAIEARKKLKNKMKTSGQKKIEEKEEFYNEKRNEFEQYLKELKANAAKETPPQNSKASEMKTGGFKKNKRKRKRKTKRKRKRKRKTKLKRKTRRKR